jgi:hypothetical protein
MQQRKYIFLNIQYLALTFISIAETLLNFESIHKYIRLKFRYSKLKNDLPKNNLEPKIMEFQNKFYLYKQNLPYGKRTTQII